MEKDTKTTGEHVADFLRVRPLPGTDEDGRDFGFDELFDLAIAVAMTDFREEIAEIE